MGIAFLHGNGGVPGGGSGAGLTIVGGTARPAKATQNTIWINTDVEITSYVLSATEPENPIEGMAWITIGNSGSVKMTSPISDEWITVYPLSAKQYVGGAWVTKEPKSYQEGEWKTWITHLYRNGDECTYITNGWVYMESEGSSWTKYEDRIAISASYSSGHHHAAGAVCTDNAIDLTNVNTIYALCEASIGSSGGVYPGIFASDIKTGWCNEDLPAYLMVTNTSEPTWFALDVSGLSGKYYVGLGMHPGHWDGSATATLRELYMST